MAWLLWQPILLLCRVAVALLGLLCILTLPLLLRWLLCVLPLPLLLLPLVKHWYVLRAARWFWVEVDAQRFGLRGHTAPHTIPHTSWH